MRIKYSIFILMLLCSVKNGLFHQELKQSSPMKLEAGEKFRDFFPISNDNFTKIVLESRMPWIVVFHNGNLGLEWKKIGAQLRGMLRFAMVDMNVEKTLCEKLEIDPQKPIRVYPYGSKKIKENFRVDLKTPLEAVQEADLTLPCKLHSFRKTTSLQNEIARALDSKPPKLPVIYLTDKEDCRSLPTLFKTIAMKLQNYFQFSYISKPKPEDFEELGFDTRHKYPVPGILVLKIWKDNSIGKLKLAVVQFSDSLKDNELNFANVFTFLHAANYQLRPDLPGHNPQSDADLLAAKDILQEESDLYDIREHSPLRRTYEKANDEL